MAFEHEHPVDAVAVLPAGTSFVGVTVAGVEVPRVDSVHGTVPVGPVGLELDVGGRLVAKVPLSRVLQLSGHKLMII